MSSDAARNQAEEFKTEGNTAFKAKNFPLAIKHFSAAIELCPEEITYYSNRSAAYLGHGEKSDDKEQLELALVDADKCISLIAAWPKGYTRRANALHALGRYEEAVKAFAQGVVECPSDANLTKGMAHAQKVLEAVRAGKPVPGTEKKKSKKSKKNKKKKGKKNGDDEEKKEDDEDQKYVIGIDLGTTFSCVGVWKDDGVHIITNEDGERTTPSYVCFDEEGNRHTGQQAKAMQSRCPESTVYDVKRVIGQRWSDSGVEKDIRSFPFKMVKGDDDKPMVELPVGNGKKELFAPESISAMVLGRLKKVAEDYLGCPVQDAVITVPAYFNDAQRNATKAAGLIAGLNVMRIINEPTAAALSYGLDNAKGNDKPCNVLIFDLGGGTFDVSLLKIENGVFEVKATAGDTRLGGEDFDHATVDFLLDEAVKQGFADAKSNRKVFRRLRIAAEKAKRVLSVQQTAEIRVETMGAAAKDFVFELTREKFESINSGLFERCLDTVKRVLKDGKMKQGEVDEVVLVGGSTRVPKIQQMLQEFLGGKALCKSLNPDEAVAYGAAVQGAILSGRRNAATDNLLLMDVTPLSLGIETTGRVMSVIIPRNSAIPCVKTQTYTTEADYQTQVDISVYEGERLKTEENNLLGEFTISGIQRAKKGEPKVDVQFSLDSNGILTVKAKDQETGAEANIEIANRGRASAEEIERMVAEAEKYRREDERRVKAMEAANRLEETINEAIEHVENIRSSEPKLAALVEKAATEHMEWLEANRESGSASDFNKRSSELERRLASKNRH